MDTILAGANDGGNAVFNIVLFALAGLRLYLEIVGTNLAELPVSKTVLGPRAKSFHRYGLYLSIGYVLWFAPSILLGYGT